MSENGSGPGPPTISAARPLWPCWGGHGRLVILQMNRLGASLPPFRSIWCSAASQSRILYVHRPCGQHTRTLRTRQPKASENCMRRTSQEGGAYTPGKSLLLRLPDPREGSYDCAKLDEARSVAKAAAVTSLITAVLLFHASNHRSYRSAHSKKIRSYCLMPSSLVEHRR